MLSKFNSFLKRAGVVKLLQQLNSSVMKCSLEDYHKMEEFDHESHVKNTSTAMENPLFQFIHW